MFGQSELKDVANFLGHTATETFAIGVPQLFKPAIEQWANKSFFTDRPIIGDRLKGLKPSEQKEPWTSEALQLIGGALNVSPKRAEVLLKGYFSTFGAFVLGGVDILAENIGNFPDQPTKRIDDYPLFGRFVRKGEPARYTRQQTWFYETFGELDELVKTINHYKQIGEYDKARKLATEKKEQVKLKKLFNRKRTRLGEINRRIRKIMWSKTLTPDQKEKMSDRLLQKKNELTNKTYNKYK